MSMVSSFKEEPRETVNQIDWNELVESIQRGDTAAMERLYLIFSRGVKFYLTRQLHFHEIEDKVHDTFLIVVNAIKRGELREPERLMGYVRTIVRRQIAMHIDAAVQVRRDSADLESGYRVADLRNDPEESILSAQRLELMTQILRAVSTRDREILTRFYLREESQERICSEMGLSETQFRLLKSRAKARFGELGRRKLARKNPGEVILRKSAGA